MYAFTLPPPFSDAGNALAAFDPTKTSSTRMAPIGACAWFNHATYGLQLYRQAKSTLITVVGTVYQFDVSAVDNESFEIAAVESVRVNTAGVAQTVFASGVYCWLLVRGQGLGLGDGTSTIGKPLNVAGTVGRVSDEAASASSTTQASEWLGYFVDAGADGATGKCHFSIY